MSLINKQYGKNSKFSFILFVVIYTLSASEWELPMSSILRWIGMGIMLVCGLYSSRAKDIKIPKCYTIIAVTYFVWMFIGIKYVSIGIQRAFSFFLLIFALYIYLKRKNAKAEEMIAYYKILCIDLCVLMLALVVYYFVKGGELGEYKGIYSNKNYLVSVSCTATACGIYLTGTSKGFAKILSIICTAAGIFITIATGSRAGIVCTAFLMLLTPFVLMEASTILRKIRVIVFMFVVMVIGVVIAKYADIPALNRLFETSTSSTPSGSTGFSRGEIWEVALDIFKHRPLMGWGHNAVYYNTFVKNISDPYIPVWGIHSSYFMILIDYGVIGTLLHILFFIMLIKRDWMNFKIAHKHLNIYEMRFIKILVAICAMLMINAIAEAFLFAVGNISSVCFWLSLVLLDVFLELKAKENIDGNFIKT